MQRCETSNLIVKSSNQELVKRQILLYRSDSEWNFCCILMLLSATYTGHILVCIQLIEERSFGKAKLSTLNSERAKHNGSII